MHRHYFFIFAIWLTTMLSTGCAASEPTAAPPSPTATQQVVSFTTPAATSTPLPTNTPTLTSTPAPTNSSTPTVEPPTNTPPPSPTDTPAPVEPPTDTPAPVESSATPLPPPTVSLTNDHNPKKGVSFAYPNCEDLETLGLSWYINFSHMPSDGCPTSDKRFVPVIYGKNEANDDAILATAIDNAKASGWLIGYGEPNLRGTNPLEGAMAWRRIEQAALPAGIKLVSSFPSPHKPYSDLTGQAEPNGYNWTWKMVEEYQNLYGAKPHFDALGWNYYLINEDPNTGKKIFPPIPQNTIDFLSLRRQEALDRGYDVPFWILEYAGACWHSVNFPQFTYNIETMQLVTPWFKDTPWIGRYAWFSNRIRGDEPWGIDHQSCSLINPDTGQPTALGESYIGY